MELNFPIYILDLLTWKEWSVVCFFMLANNMHQLSQLSVICNSKGTLTLSHIGKRIYSLCFGGLILVYWRLFSLTPLYRVSVWLFHFTWKQLKSEDLVPAGGEVGGGEGGGGRPFHACLSTIRPCRFLPLYPTLFYPKIHSRVSLSLIWKVGIVQCRRFVSSRVTPQRLERGGPCWLLKLRQIGMQGVHKKEFFLGWFVGLVVLAQEIFVLPWLL